MKKLIAFLLLLPTMLQAASIPLPPDVAITVPIPEIQVLDLKIASATTGLENNLITVGYHRPVNTSTNGVTATVMCDVRATITVPPAEVEAYTGKSFEVMTFPETEAGLRAVAFGKLLTIFPELNKELARPAPTPPVRPASVQRPPVKTPPAP